LKIEVLFAVDEAYANGGITGEEADQLHGPNREGGGYMLKPGHLSFFRAPLPREYIIVAWLAGFPEVGGWLRDPTHEFSRAPYAQIPASGTTAPDGYLSYAG
jgi:hypothetical protein